MRNITLIARQSVACLQRCERKGSVASRPAAARLPAPPLFEMAPALDVARIAAEHWRAASPPAFSAELVEKLRAANVSQLELSQVRPSRCGQRTALRVLRHTRPSAWSSISGHTGRRAVRRDKLSSYWRW